MLNEEQRLKHNARGRARYRENIEKRRIRRLHIKKAISYFAISFFAIGVAVAIFWK